MAIKEHYHIVTSFFSIEDNPKTRRSRIYNTVLEAEADKRARIQKENRKFYVAPCTEDCVKPGMTRQGVRDLNVMGPRPKKEET